MQVSYDTYSWKKMGYPVDTEAALRKELAWNWDDADSFCTRKFLSDEFCKDDLGSSYYEN